MRLPRRRMEYQKFLIELSVRPGTRFAISAHLPLPESMRVPRAEAAASWPP